MNITTFLNRIYFTPRLKEIEQYAGRSAELQERVMLRLTRLAAGTEWGKKYSLGTIRTYRDFHDRMPIQTYEDIKGYVARMRQGEQGLLWPSEIRWFAKSSGTTNDKSKFLPVSRESLHDTHYQGGQGRRGPLPGAEPAEPTVQRQRPHPGRQPRPQPQQQPQPGGRPLRHPDTEHQPAGEPHPRPLQADSPDGRLRGQDGSHRQEHHRAERHQPLRRALVDAGAHQAHPGKDRQTKPGGGMAQPGGILPRRRGLHPLPRAIPIHHPQPRACTTWRRTTPRKATSAPKATPPTPPCCS